MIKAMWWPLLRYHTVRRKLSIMHMHASHALACALAFLTKGDTKTGGLALGRLDRFVERGEVGMLLSSSKPYDVAYRENSEIRQTIPAKPC